jgi:hypothetical protein
MASIVGLLNGLNRLRLADSHQANLRVVHQWQQQQQQQQW